MATEAATQSGDDAHVHAPPFEDRLTTCPLCGGSGKIDPLQLLKDLQGLDIQELLDKSGKAVIEGFDLEAAGFVKEIVKTVGSQIEERYRKDLETAGERLSEEKLKHQRAMTDAAQKSKEERDTLVNQMAELTLALKQAREEKTKLEVEMKKVPARIGDAGEKDFQEEACARFPHYDVSEKLTSEGDFIIRPKVPRGSDLVDIGQPVLIDHKRKESKLTRGDIDKTIKDAKRRGLNFAMVVAQTMEQLRNKDLANRVTVQEGNILLVLTSREIWAYDMQMLLPHLEARAAAQAGGGVDHKAALDELCKALAADITKLDAVFKHTRAIKKEAEGVDEVVRSAVETMNGRIGAATAAGGDE